MKALEPCPFCGGTVFIHRGPTEISYITCGQRDDGSDGCGAIVSFRPRLVGNAAIAKFNDRASPAQSTTRTP